MNTHDENLHPTLHDKVRQACAHQRMMTGVLENDGEHKKDVHQFGRELPAAQRFVLAPDMIEMASHLSVSEPEFLFKMWQRARAPFEKTWIEIDELERLSVYENLGFPMDPQSVTVVRLGFYVERLPHPHSETFYKMTVCTEQENGKISVQPAALFFDLSNEILPNTHFNMLCDSYDSYMFDMSKYLLEAEKANSEDMKEFANFSQLVFGSPYYVLMELQGSKNTINVLNQMTHNTRFAAPKAMRRALHDYHRRIITNHIKNSGGNPQNGGREATKDVMRHMFHACSSITGDLRFLIAVLGILNTPVVAGKTVAPFSTRPVKVGMKKVNFMSHQRVTLKLPTRRENFNNLMQHIGHGTGIPRRAHVVRGHWRFIPSRDEEVWLDEFVRGRSDLGFVNKDYVMAVQEKCKRKNPKAQRRYRKRGE